MLDEPSRLFAFAEFELDEERRELLQDGVPVELQLKPTQLLLYLVQNCDREVSKRELLDEIWPDAVVSEATLRSTIRHIRRALSDKGTSQRFVRIRRGRGYRFVASVETRPIAERAGGVGPFVGRGAILNELQDALQAARGGRGRTVLLPGEPGIGKTRTGEELASMARDRGVGVLVGRCFEGDGARPYWPWIQVLRALVETRSDAELRADTGPGASDIAQILLELRERFPDLPDPPQLEPAEARFRLLDSISTFLKRAAARQPLLLILDDLHCADAPALRLLAFLSREIDESAILLLGTYRDVALDAGHPLMKTLAELSRAHHCSRTPLEGLLLEEVQELVRLLQRTELSPGQIEAIFKRTDGNPFFIKELLATGEISEWKGSGSEGSFDVPQSLREVILGRRQDLTTDSNRFLDVAAVIGRDFAPEVVQAASGLHANVVAEALRQARVLGLVSRETTGVARFRHALIQEAVYAELDGSRRVELHGHVGEALERLFAENLGPHLSELAHHFCEAEAGWGAEKAIDYAVRAGQRACELLAWEEGIRSYADGLRVLDLRTPADVERRCELVLALAQAQHGAGDYSESMKSWELATSIARELGDPLQLANAAAGHSVAHWMAPRETLLERLEFTVQLLGEALSALGGMHPSLQARLLSRLAIVVLQRDRALGGDQHQRERSVAESREASLAAVRIARRAGDLGILVDALEARQRSLKGPDHLEERIEVSNELERAALAAGVADSRPSVARMELAFDLGDIAAAEVAIESYKQVAAERRDPVLSAFSYVQEATISLLRGRFEECERDLRSARAYRAPGHRLYSFMAYVIFSLRKAQGRLAEREAVTRSTVERTLDVTGNCYLALLYSELGRKDLARRWFEVLAQNQFRRLHRDEFWLPSLAQLSEVCAFLIDIPRAVRLYDLISPYAARVVSSPIVCYGPASHFLGLLAATRSRFDDAIRHFEDALDRSERMEATPFVAGTQYHYARTLLSRARPGDRELALTLASEARAITDELGMKALRERIEELQL